MKRLLLFNLLAIISLNVIAQSSIIKGRVVNPNNQGVEYATVALLSVNDFQLKKGTACDDKGYFLIENIPLGSYIVSVRMLGYDTDETSIITIDNDKQLIERIIVIKESTYMMNEVVVADRYAFVEQTLDKTIVNPNASIISSAESVYEILKKSPGVNIDNNDNITLKGMQGVIVMIDNKPSKLSSSELAQILKGMIGKNIRSIEIIENPSARHEAEGNAGIINIKTKHNKAPGFNGSINSGITFTRTTGANAGLDMNMNFGKLNVYGNYSFFDWKGWYKMDGYRKFISNESINTTTFMSNESKSDGSAHNYKVGADYYFSRKHVLSIMLNGNNGRNELTDEGISAFKNVLATNDSSVSSLTERLMQWNNNTLNFNYKWEIDSLGWTLTADADYARFNFGSHADQISNYSGTHNSGLIQTATLWSAVKNRIEIQSVKIDYSQPLSRNVFLETGLKFSRVNIESIADMEGYINQNDEFNYHENIQAAYINSRAEFKSTAIQLGLRIENTQSLGNSISTQQRDENSYMAVFPSLFIQRTLTQKQTLGFRYSYRIGRPNYNVLNPFKWMMDPYTYNLGNPKLNPQFSHSISLNHSFEGKFMTSVGFNKTLALFTEVIYQDEATKSAYQTTENFGTSTDWSISETFLLQPLNWWRFTGTLAGMFKDVKAKATIGGSFQQFSYIANMSHSFQLPYQSSLELSGRYASQQLFGNIFLQPHYSIDLGFQIQVLNNKGTLRASMSDIFNTGSAGMTSRYGNLELDINTHAETRRFNISFNYRFGKSDLNARSNRSTASMEEQSRSTN